MWLIADFEPVTCFSMRPSNTTASGGKSLLCPTPYAIKTALLSSAIRFLGKEQGVAIFPQLVDMQLALRLPQQTAVNRTFQKVLRPKSKSVSWQSTIAQREFCWQSGNLSIAIETDEAELWGDLFLTINYFGRKGSFFQCVRVATMDEMPPLPYVLASREAQAQAVNRFFGLLQRMDDFAPDITFDDVDIFNSKAKGGRVQYSVMFPYQMIGNGSNYTLYALERQGS